MQQNQNTTYFAPPSSDNRICECGHGHGHHYRTEWASVTRQDGSRVPLPCQGGENEDCGCTSWRPQEDTMPVQDSKRTITQVVTSGTNCIYALCNDGTLWQMLSGSERGWFLIKDVPQDEVE